MDRMGDFDDAGSLRTHVRIDNDGDRVFCARSAALTLMIGYSFITSAQEMTCGRAH